PRGAAFDSATEEVYVANERSANVSVINGSSVVASISLPPNSDPNSAAFDSSNGNVYLTDQCSGGSECVSVIHGTAITTSIPLEGASVATFDSANQRVYVAGTNATGGHVYVISGASVVASISLPNVAADSTAAGIAFDSINGYVYSAWGGYGLTSSEEVSVINGTSVIESIYPSFNGANLLGATFDPAAGLVDVTYDYVDYPSGYVWVINGSNFYPTISSFTANPDVVEIDSSSASTTMFEVNSTRGEGPSNFTYADLPPGCVTSNTSNLMCTPNRPGAYAVHVLVTDSAGYSAEAATMLTVDGPITASATATPNRTDAGVLMSFASNPSGGIGPDTFAWLFGDGGSSDAQNPFHAYGTSGSYSAQVWVNDSAGVSTKSTVLVSIDTALQVALSVSNATPVLGQSIAIDVNATGGVAPYTYAYVGLPPGCVSVNGSTIGCFPTQAGYYNLSATVTDQNGVSTNSSTPLEIVFEFTVAVPARTTVNHAFSLSVHVYGSDETLTYNYVGLPPGCASVDAPQVVCTPTRVGSYNISISVQDLAGHHATHQVRVEVVSGGSQSIWSFLESPLLLGGLIAALVAIVLVAVVLNSGRRSSTSPRSDLYSAYRVSPRTASPSGPDSPSPTQRGRPVIPPGSPSSEAAEEDSLSDLV
ncbi:MAG: PKD domain-containing protein, partial [Thermoplasmata archaeon]